MDQIPEDFSSRLRHFLNNAKISNSSLALMMEVSSPTISGWITGKKQPSIENLIKLSETLNLSLCWLLHGKGHPNLLGPIQVTPNEKDMITKLRELPINTTSNFINFLASATDSENGEALVNKANAWNFIEHANLAAVILDQEWIIQDINSAYLKLLNINQEQSDLIVDTSFLHWIAPKEQAETLLNIVRAKTDENFPSFQTMHIRLNESDQAHVLLHCSHYKNDNIAHFVINAFPIPASKSQIHRAK